MRIAPQTFRRQTCSVWYNYNTCVESVLSCAMLQKNDNADFRRTKFMFLGADINLSATVWSAADRITKLTFVASAGWSDFTLRFGGRNSKKKQRWPVKDSRGKGFHIFWCSTSITFILPSPWRDVALRRCSIDENCAANLLQRHAVCDV